MRRSIETHPVDGRHFRLSFTTTLKRPLAGGRYLEASMVVFNEA